ncbi:MAG: hypothetical protein JJE39_13005 [Vicinamibacteria bacterium]|nr:hypothetical protein [Vicinamibacteria bacterium]
MRRRTWWLVGCAGLWIGAAAGKFEPPPTFLASSILPPDLVKGLHYEVAEAVTAESHYQTFQIASPYGDLRAEGRSVLVTRLLEFDALARLDDVSKTAVFAKAAGGAVLNVGKGVVNVVTAPEATLKGVGSGVKRFGVNLGRKGKRAVTATEAVGEGGENDKSTGAKAGEAAGHAALSIVGVNGAARKWAKKLNVDPYTSNPLLHQALVSLGKIDTAGRIAAIIVVPIPVVASATSTVGGLVWDADPEEVRKVNERRMGELGVSKLLADRFFKSPAFTLTNATRFIGALHSVMVPGCDDYVSAAAESEDERDALFFVESAELLAGLHQAQPVRAILVDSRTLVVKMDGARAIAFLPFDYVYWTEALARSTIEIAARARKELGARFLQIDVTGTATTKAKTGLGAAGWKVKERVTEGLLVKPAGG